MKNQAVDKRVYRLRKSAGGYQVLCDGRRVASRRTFNDAVVKALLLKYHDQQKKGHL